MSAPFSGLNRELGRDMKLGLETYWDHLNHQGGVAGRQVRLVALDDGYEPERALANLHELYEKRKVFAVIGNVGTPTAERTLPYAQDNHLLFLFPFTGAKFLRRDPPDRYVFNYRASYEEETAEVVRYLVESKRVAPDQIAVFAQQDSYGESGFAGVARMLRKYNRSPEQILHVGCPRNSVEVGEAVREVVSRKDDIRAIIMVTTYRPAARFIQKVRDAGVQAIFTNVSFVGSSSLAEELIQLGPSYAEGVIVTQVVPPIDSQSTAVLQFRERLRSYAPNEQPSFVSLEGYLGAAIFAEGLRRADKDLTTDTLIDALESIRDLDLGIGGTIRFGPSEHQASHKVWGTILDKTGHYNVLDLEQGPNVNPPLRRM
jgi:ABC-type branched-subunit amino acid transport system substrate-binding protein